MKITNLKYPYLSIVLLALTVAIASLHADTFGPFTYEIDGTSGHVTITVHDNSPGDIVIPAEIAGRTVTTIGSWAFFNCSRVTRVTIPDSVTGIGQGAFFNCSGLTSLIIPKNVTVIGSRAFTGCTQLTEILVGSGNPSFASHEGALFNSAMTQIIDFPEGKIGPYTIPEAVTEINPDAFSDCRGLTSVTIPPSVTEIPFPVFGFPFTGCTNLKQIVVPQGNPSFSSHDGILYNATMTELIRCPEGKIGHVLIPEGVNEVHSVFEFLNSASRFESFAFKNCRELTRISFPSTFEMPSISAARTFSDCERLQALDVASDNPQFKSVDGVLFNKAMTSLLAFPRGKTGAFTIPDRVTEIYSGHFGGCSLTTVTIPTSVTSIVRGAFAASKKLQSIHVEAGNENYASIDGVLLNAEANTLLQVPAAISGTYRIPESVIYISGKYYNDFGRAYGSPAFDGCDQLTTVIFPKNLSEIDGVAFRDCESLSSAVFLGDAPTMNYEHLDLDGAPDITIYYLAGSTGFTSPTWEGYPSVMIDTEQNPAAIWLLEHGLPHDTDLQQDHNNDGVNLLTTYALNLDPNENPSSKLPEPILTPEALTLTFHAASPGISYTVETSTDLKSWTTTNVTLSDLNPDNQRTAAVPRTPAQRFLRLIIAQ